MNQVDWLRLRLLLFNHSYKEGTFKLTSGKESDFYIDCKQTTLSAEGAYLCGGLLHDKIIQSKIHVVGVGGMTLGADPLVTAVSMISFLRKRAIPAFIIRKEPKGHGTGSWIEGKRNIPPKGCVSLVEDVVTTGGTLIKAIKRTEEEGYKVAQIITVADREEGGKEALLNVGHKLISLFTRKDILEIVENERRSV